MAMDIEHSQSNVHLRIASLDRWPCFYLLCSFLDSPISGVILDRYAMMVEW